MEEKNHEEKQGAASAAKPKKPKKRERVKTPEASVYVGPTLRNGQLARSTVFRGGKLPAHVAKLSEEHKAIARLIVPVSQLASAERKLRDPSSAEAAAFAEAARLFSKGGK